MLHGVTLRVLVLALGTISFILFLHAQNLPKLDEVNSTMPKSYPIHASDFLGKKELEVRKYISEHPEAMKSQSLRKTTTYIVGDKKSWYADDLSIGFDIRYLVPSTCKAVGSHCYIFVEDTSWTAGRVNQNAVDSVCLYFDSKTPANPSKGIFETDTATFGNPPDVDQDSKIIILLLDIKDGYSGSGGYIAGYFYSLNEINPSQPNYSTSNFTEMFYIDINPANLATASGLTDALSTLAHEFQHMIHFHYDMNELTFIDEGCSVLAEVNCGFPIYSQSYYSHEPNHYLLDWRSIYGAAVFYDYSRAARFFVYIRDQVGMEFFKPFVASTLTGTAGIDAGFQAINSPLRFADLLKNWFIANELDDRIIDPKYGYVYPGLPRSAGLTSLIPNVPLTTDMVQNYAVQYITFKFSSQLKATFTVNNPALVLKAVEIGPSSKRVLDVTSGVEFSDPLYGSAYTEIEFVIMNTDPSTSYTYSYRASGVSQNIELRYDYSEPTGVYSLAANDTVCVTFEAFQGGRLDSIRVALRRNTAIRSGIWKYTGFARPSPLGTPLALNLSATGSSSPDMLFPVPWPNWATIDLRSKNISTNSPFAVGFIMDGDYGGTTYNYVMETSALLGNRPTSFTYSSNSTSGPNWYYYYSNYARDSLVTYLVRAYVSFPATDVRRTVELRPSAYTLGQNYPNPFNPSTAIRFDLPLRSFVTLKIYDVVGREIATLLNGYKEAGTHELKFDASGLPSGVYLYRISTDKFVETKKFVLLK
jgi:hypothetical protein